MAQDAVASGRDDEYWVIPTAQRDPVKATKLARLMQDHGLEVRLRADKSAYLLPTRQPFVKFADEMLDPSVIRRCARSRGPASSRPTTWPRGPCRC